MKTLHQSFSVTYSYPVIFTRDAFAGTNAALVEVLAASGQKPHRVLPVVDANLVLSSSGLLEKIERYGQDHPDILEFVRPPFIMRGGETSKNDPLEVEKLHALTEKHHLCRHSFLLVIGGGAVLDAAGYAAATAHRGIRLIRMPTTTLAQSDAGIGVKNGLNAFGRKNYLGTFAPPFAVINDFTFLDTLSLRERRAGIAEAIKVSLIKDRAFFDDLHRERHKLAACDQETLEKTIVRCAEIHLGHISRGGDPFEYGTSRPLDFGHWAAHHLEEISQGGLNHGEAVAIGIALDALYACHLGLISELEWTKIIQALEDVGFDLYHWALGWMDIAGALRSFQEHLGGELTVTLPAGIGEKTEVHEMDTALLRQCIETLQKRRKGTATGLDANIRPLMNIQ